MRIYFTRKDGKYISLIGYQITTEMLIIHPHLIEDDEGWIEMDPIAIEYYQLLSSGMFWEFFPELTGEWLKDKEQFLKLKQTLQNI